MYKSPDTVSHAGFFITPSSETLSSAGKPAYLKKTFSRRVVFLRAEGEKNRPLTSTSLKI